MGRQGFEVSEHGIAHVVGNLRFFDPGVDFHGLEQSAQRDMKETEPSVQRGDVPRRGLAMLPGMDTEFQDEVLSENLLERLGTVVRHGRGVPGLGLLIVQ